jgi:hypothetical protein
MKLQWRKAWPILLVTALLGLVLVSSSITLRSIWSGYRVYRTGTDGPSIWVQRMSSLDQALPKSFDVLGYISEGEVPGVEFNPIDHDEEFVMSQYFLAPRVLELGADRPLVMVNISSPSVKPADLEARFHLKLVKNYGWGIALYKQVEP